jgi:hypothetical protein
MMPIRRDAIAATLGPICLLSGQLHNDKGTIHINVLRERHAVP